jgi:hypothetical protein
MWEVGQCGPSSFSLSSSCWCCRDRVRLLPLGGTAWINCKHDAVNGWWYRETVPGVQDDPVLTAGMGVVFLRYGPPDASDASVLAPWYLRPPNEW